MGQTHDLAVLTEVGKRYGNGTVGLHPTTITFRSDQLTVLLGPSGAGKSTLLRTVNHLAEPTSGRLQVSGIGEISDRQSLRAHRRQTAMIFQQHQLIGRLSALQNALVGRLAHYPSWRTLWPLPHRDQVLALDCLDRVGLLKKALQRCDNLSGGEQQRVGIARALVQQPKLILADEPVASLDPATSRRVLSLLRDICRQDGIPEIVSLHQLELAREFADRIVGLAGGRVVYDGSAEDLGQRHLAEIYGGDISTPQPKTREAPPISPPPAHVNGQKQEAYQ